MRISDWSSDVCSSDLLIVPVELGPFGPAATKQVSDSIQTVNQRRKTPIHVVGLVPNRVRANDRSEEHTSELQSLMRISYAVFCLKKKKKQYHPTINYINTHNTITKISYNSYYIHISHKINVYSSSSQIHT